MKAIELTCLALLSIGLGACSPQEKQQTQAEAHKAGEAVKKELKNDAQFVRVEAQKARDETQKGVRKLKAGIDSKNDDRHVDPERNK